MPTPGIYATNSTGETVPLALEDGTGDKKLLAEAIDERLEKEELDYLINELIASAVERARREEAEA